MVETDGSTKGLLERIISGQSHKIFATVTYSKMNMLVLKTMQGRAYTTYLATAVRYSCKL